jgi:hypothetical protein
MPDEELYDLTTDPFEVRNLATSNSPEHQQVLKRLRGVLEKWIEETNDQGRIPEPPDDAQPNDNAPKRKAKRKA